MRRITLSLSLMLLAACGADEPVEVEAPPALPRSHLVVCTGQQEIGDSWQIALHTRNVQLDAAGNAYVSTDRAPSCAQESTFESGEWGVITKVGARGNIEWVRGWSQPYDVPFAVAPSGEIMVLDDAGRFHLVGTDGAILVEGRPGTGGSALGATTSGFLVAGSYAHQDSIVFDGHSFEATSLGGLFVILLDPTLTPETVQQPLPHDIAVSRVLSVVGLSGGDVITAYHDADFGKGPVIHRSGAQSWRVALPGPKSEAGLHRLDDDSVVVHTGSTLSRYAAGGMLLWSRDYTLAFPYEKARSFSKEPRRGGFILPATDGAELAVAFVAHAEGEVETSAGPVVPDGTDVGFATIDTATGLLSRVTLEPAPGDQIATAAALSGASLVVASSDRPPGGKGSTSVLTRYASVP